MKTIYTAKYLVPGDAPPVEGGALLVADGRIAAVASCRSLKRSNPGVEVVAFADAVLVPLLVNAHTHLELTDFPQWAQDAGDNSEPDGFVDWILRLVRIKQKLNKDQYRVSLANGIAQSVAAGTGVIGDVLAHHAARDIYRDGSLSGCLFLETLGQDPAVIQRLRKGLDEALQEQQVGAVALGISPHSPYTIRAGYLKDVYDRCRRDGLRATTHLAESPDEVEFVEYGHGALASRFYPSIGWETYIPPAAGLRPVEYLRQRGGLFPENLLVHGVQLNDAEIRLLADRRMFLALCPRSNARLRVGRAPAGKLHQAGVRLALGTDSLASCDSLSVWDELAFAAHCFAGELDAPTLFHMATLGGAGALGLEADFGSLNCGKQAGFQVLRPKTTVAKDELFDYLVSPGCGDDIIQVYCQGTPRLSGLV